MPIVYRHIRLDKNEPFYIGIGNNISRAKSTIGRNEYWKSIVKNTDYEIEILFDNLSWEDACEKEKEFIKLYGRKDIGTGILANMTDGGDGLKNPSTENRERIRNRLLGNTYNRGLKRTDETIVRIKSARAKQIITEEHKKKISESNKGRKVSEETRKKIGIKNSIALKGRKLPKEVCEKMSNSRRGEKNFNYKISDDIKNYILQNYKKGDKINGMQVLCKKFDISCTSFFRILKQK